MPRWVRRSGHVGDGAGVPCSLGLRPSGQPSGNRDGNEKEQQRPWDLPNCFKSLSRHDVAHDAKHNDVEQVQLVAVTAEPAYAPSGDRPGRHGEVPGSAS